MADVIRLHFQTSLHYLRSKEFTAGVVSYWCAAVIKAKHAVVTLIG